jgi:hypothetical protein
MTNYDKIIKHFIEFVFTTEFFSLFYCACCLTCFICTLIVVRRNYNQNILRWGHIMELMFSFGWFVGALLFAIFEFAF